MEKLDKQLSSRIGQTLRDNIAWFKIVVLDFVQSRTGKLKGPMEFQDTKFTK